MMIILKFIFLISFTFLIHPAVTSDNPEYIVFKAAAVVTLRDSWIACNQNGSIILNATVPGCIHTDLKRKNVIGDPYFKYNDVLYNWVAKEKWTYRNKFEVDCHLLQKDRILLILHGVDTVSQIYLNNNFLGLTDNMFVKYQFDIKSLLQTNNMLEVAIESPVEYSLLKHSLQVLKYVIPPTCPPPVQNGECHVNYIRKMQSSFSWDWGPSFPTQGIWKPVEIIGFDSLIISYVTVRTSPNDLKMHGTFRSITMTIFTETASNKTVTGFLQININETSLFKSNISFKPDNQLKAAVNLILKLPKSFKPELWWPNGLGSQPLYTIKVLFSTKNEKCSKVLQFGFKTVELIQESISNSSGLSFYFEVNGMPFFAKGSNWIPADSFLERVTPEYTENLLQSAKDANMNMLRVWGGGIYENDRFYELADQKGILIWQDLMFACALYPTDDIFLQSVIVEVTQQVCRLQHHASLLLWSGNNENEQSISGSWWPAVSQNLHQYKKDYIKLYIDTIMPIVQAEDPSHPFLPSSPSNGPETIEEGWIAADPQDTHYGDVHFYSYAGSEWEPSAYPRARFVSEYGFQSYPSFESLAKVSEPEDWVFPFNNFMQQRQHHMFGNAQIARMIEEHFILPPKSCGTKGFKDVLYLSQIVQAMAIKTETEKYLRSQSEIVEGEGKTMGALYWQLNDIWQGPSWSSIEYGGKWKMLHYYAKNFFAPIIVSPFIENEFFSISIISDQQKLMNLQLNISVFQWSSLQPVFSNTIALDKVLKGSQVVFTHTLSDFLQNGGCISKDVCFLYFELYDSEQLLSSNTLFLSEFHSAVGIEKPQTEVNISGPFKTEFSDFTFNIHLKTDSIAPFVWLNFFDVPGRFSNNGFLLVYESIDVFFYSLTNISLNDISKNFTIQSLKDVCVSD